MITAKFTDRKSITIPGLSQYDYGQTLRIEGLQLPSVVQVHFSLEEMRGTAQIRVGNMVNGAVEVQIPDELLRQETKETYSIFAWVYVDNGVTGKTECKMRIPVELRSKPADYTDEDEDRLKNTLEKMMEVAETMEQEVNSLKKKIDNFSKNVGEILQPSDVQTAVDKYLESNTIDGLFTPDNLVLYEASEESTVVTAKDIIAEVLSQLELKVTKNQALGLYLGDVLIDSIVLDEFKTNEIICTGLTVSPAESTVYGKGTVELIATAEPLDCTQKVRWFTDDESMATVQNGTVTLPGKSGSVSIVAVCGNYRATSKITVEQYVYTDFDWQIGLLGETIGAAYSRGSDSQNMRISSAYIATPVDTEIIMTGGTAYKFEPFFYKDGKLVARAGKWNDCNMTVKIKADEYDGVAFKVMRNGYAKWDNTFIETFAKTVSIQSV